MSEDKCHVLKTIRLLLLRLGTLGRSRVRWSRHKVEITRPTQMATSLTWHTVFAFLFEATTLAIAMRTRSVDILCCMYALRRIGSAVLRANCSLSLVGRQLTPLGGSRVHCVHVLDGERERGWRVKHGD
jgi:hypothetical protein